MTESEAISCSNVSVSDTVISVVLEAGFCRQVSCTNTSQSVAFAYFMDNILLRVHVLCHEVCQVMKQG